MPAFDNHFRDWLKTGDSLGWDTVYKTLQEFAELEGNRLRLCPADISDAVNELGVQFWEARLDGTLNNEAVERPRAYVRQAVRYTLWHVLENRKKFDSLDENPSAQSELPASEDTTPSPWSIKRIVQVVPIELLVEVMKAIVPNFHSWEYDLHAQRVKYEADFAVLGKKFRISEAAARSASHRIEVKMKIALNNPRVRARAEKVLGQI